MPDGGRFRVESPLRGLMAQGGPITPEMRGAVGYDTIAEAQAANAVDSTSAVQAAIDTGLPVFFPKIYATTTLRVATGDSKYLYSDGSGGVASHTSFTSGPLLWVQTSGVKVENMVIAGDVSTVAGVVPKVQYSLLVGGTGVTANDSKVLYNKISGGIVGYEFTTTTSTENGWFIGNEVSDAFGDGTIVNTPKNFYFCNNVIHDCGVDGTYVDSACHFTTLFYTEPGENLIITGNVVRDCMTGDAWIPTLGRQEAMDFFSARVRNIVVSDNVVTNVNNGGFEFKSELSAASPDFYGNVTIANNIVNFRIQDFAITGVTLANPAVVTCVGHGIANGTPESRWIHSLGGIVELNDQYVTCTYVDADHVSIGVNTSSGYTAYTSGGYLRKGIGTGVALNGYGSSISGIAKSTSPTIITHDIAHGIETADNWIGWIIGNSGMPQINDKAYMLTKVSSTQVSVPVDSSGFGTWTSGGVLLAAKGIPIASITQASPAVVTTSIDHGLETGDVTVVAGGQMTQINHTAIYIVRTGARTFQCKAADGSNINMSAATAYTSGGYCASNVRKKDNRNWMITGNQFICDEPGSLASAVTIAGHDNVTVSGNRADRIGTGLSIGASNGFLYNNRNIAVLSNDFRTHGYPFMTSSVYGTIGLKVIGNTFESLSLQATYMQGGRIGRLTFTGNDLRIALSSSQFIATFNNVQSGRIGNNTGRGNHSGFVIAGTASTDLKVFRNDITCVFNGIIVTTGAATVLVYENTIDNTTGYPCWTNAGSAVGWGNKKVTPHASPDATVGGNVGDMVPRTTPASGGIWMYVCTTAGDTGNGNLASVVWKGIALP